MQFYKILFFKRN